MDINIDVFDSKSVEKAIKQLNKVKAAYPRMVKKLLRWSCEWIKARAISYLLASDLGEDVIVEVQNDFHIEVNETNAILRNGEGRGYLVEFGIGIKGQGTYDGVVPPNYEYNVRTKYKNANGEWIFKTNDWSIDISPKDIISKTTSTVKTAGGEGVMFMYNSIVDFRNQKIAEQLWKQICKEYIK